MTTDDKKQKPGKWVAWHPVAQENQRVQMLDVSCEYADVVHNSFEAALAELKKNPDIIDEFNIANTNPGDVRLNLGLELIPWLKFKGWRIRPVKLVFLDEDEAEHE